jgi:two-component system phosphate regulon sensor histidine kinase PhoR
LARRCAQERTRAPALRSPEIITALREAIATSEPRRATYLDHVPVDRWMELMISPVPVPTLFGGTDKWMA